MPLHARPSGTIGAKAAVGGGRPSAQSSSQSPAKQLQNFDGVNAIQNSQATGGFDLEPPDESIAVGGNYVLNFVNLTGAIYTKNGHIAAGPFPLGADWSKWWLLQR